MGVHVLHVIIMYRLIGMFHTVSCDVHVHVGSEGCNVLFDSFSHCIKSLNLPVRAHAYSPGDKGSQAEASYARLFDC